MKVLLIAYEYPPIVAAQALRWFYLSNELAALGMEIHVLCPSVPAMAAYPVGMHTRVTEHRIWPGPFFALSQWFALRAGGVATAGTNARNSPTLALRIYRAIRFVLDRILYPDVRSEWYPFARRALARLLGQEKFDVIISSHEPGVDIFLGLWAKRHYGMPWIIDLADPLCAPYSPKWRRWLDQWVEGRVIRHADRIVLTTDRLSSLLIERHGQDSAVKYVCVPQGAPDIGKMPNKSKWRAGGKFNIVFTGNFYEVFRNPQNLARALEKLASEDIALIIAGDNARFVKMFNKVPNVSFLGRLSHFDCLSLQAEADLLLNIGNDQTYQIPGKIYEYMGSGCPILHIRSASGDPSEKLLLESGLGWIVDNEAGAIASKLSSLLGEWRAGTLSVDEADAREVVQKHGWPARAKEISDVIAEVTKNSASMC